MRSAASALVPCIWLAVAAPVGVADTPSSERVFSGEIEVVVVSVDVYVRDEDGRPVTGLEAEDFRLLDNGTEVPITHFAAITGADRVPAASTGEAEPEDTPRAEPRTEDEIANVILFMDNRNLTMYDRRRVVKQAEKFVQAVLRPPVRMMVIRRQLAVTVLQPFTDDPGAVVAALEATRKDTAERTHHDAHYQFAIEQLHECAKAPRRDLCREQMFSMCVGMAEEERLRALESIRDLAAVVERMAGLPGRKVLVHVSNGLPMIAGYQLFLEWAVLLRDEGELASARPQFDLTPLYREVVARALHAGVSFYTIDAGGTKIRTEGSVDNRYRPDSLSALQTQGNYEDAIRYMATGTGGHAIINRNRLDDGLELLSDDLVTFYSIGFTVEAANRDAEHELEVQVPERPKLEVRHRRVVYEKSAGTRVRERLVAGLLVDVADNPLGCTVTTGEPTATEEGVVQVPLEVSVPIGRLTLEPEYGAQVGHLKLYLTTEDGEGRRSDIVTQDYEVSVLPDELEDALTKTYSIGVDLVLRPGPATISVAVTDQGSGTTSFAVLHRE